ncbi:FAD-dependent monooxygenase [Nocardia terpenica]|uniref:FAD-dependent oxidoreductase n=1 Tax=Nocardia terpenica TaxID=455432 RepID=UPI001894F634|nr:NAD(P)/FAD-dependent oxidoreductase [Nocardia terpenica]MBF6065725.1 FAD-dependent monooxygenase [Nocardia terpenica]MBF6108237.1 FAD-dependent monooxygenase [Nocardia terpenica]MBF6115840.1 FAD-dependent monooxygenase [Nocardia terpenica]MBF6122970.1 FAD-dependent monooxygenase [Nocardia terpenica]MBF6155957.1 FAD-dependent monooxygenase [Nocardia terpenica]
MASGTDADAVVCGAGAGGLAAACALAAAGLAVIVLDKQRQPPSIAKGELLQPGSLTALDRWGVTRRLLAAGGVEIDRLCARASDGRALLELDYPGLLGGRRRILSADYPTILAALADSLPPSVRVHRGVPVRGPLHDDTGRVCGVEVADERLGSVRAPLVVAADGAASGLRAAAGIAVARTQYPHRLVSFDVPGARDEELTAYVTDRGLRLVYPLPHARTRLYIQAGPQELRGRDDAAMRRWAVEATAGIAALAPLGELLLDPRTQRQLFSVPRYLVDRLALPGLALVGESAHAVHPMAAQGMNSAIADAAELADRITAVGAADPAALDRALTDYERVRLPQLRHVATVSHNASRMLTAVSPVGRRLGRRLLRGTANNPRLLAATCRNIAGVNPAPLGMVDRLYQLGLLPAQRGRDIEEAMC